jgi:hypothetical protein
LYLRELRPACDFDAFAIDVSVPFVSANLLILRNACYSVGKISATSSIPDPLRPAVGLIRFLDHACRRDRV